MAQVLLWIENGARAEKMLHHARQVIGERFPGATIKQSNPKYFRGAADVIVGEGDVESCLAVVIPIKYEALLLAYQNHPDSPDILPLKWQDVPPPLPVATPPGGDTPGVAPEVAEEKQAAPTDNDTAKRIVKLDTPKFAPVVNSIDSVSFLRHLLDLEEKNYHRARCTAKTKTGTRCKRFAMSNGRCKSHGGEGPLAHGRGGRKPVERLRIIKDRIEKAIKKGQKRAAN